MIDREKVIAALTACARGSVTCKQSGCPLWGEEDDCIGKMARDALELLKTQESIEPIWALNDGEHKLWQCGNCRVAVFTRGTKYCHNCGREIKWDDRN